ncbi:uncharacterized protein LOC114932333 [Nylanderia fulva]|uniref:uncharacterized protein LOC114932333 n=1 Tax=Nylanderia fulva TaxID=613905 RepID=UPI0010FB4A69|nr:uncharacterized protein LOC114932333 [Nylanderia fulva]
MSEAKDLLIAQIDTIAQLKRVIVNFKKLAKANVTLPRTQGRLDELTSLWASCRELHVKLLQSTTPEEKKTLAYFVDEEFLVAEEAYYETADVLRDAISRLTVVTPPPLDRSTDSSFRDSNNNFQLPRISLPKFSGKFSDWENFKNTFESLVANNYALTNTQKFHYLKTSVIGDAALVINNLKISDANYDSAWQLLVDEYDDKLTLIHSHLHAFMSIPVMNRESVAELRKLRDAVAASLAALNNMQRPVDHWDDLLVYIISQKFSARTRSEWNLRRSTMNSIPSYKDIHDFLTMRIRGLSDFTDVSKESGNVKYDKQRSSVNNIAVLKCICCSGNHFISKCEEFRQKSAAQRMEIARTNKICFNCLKSGHMSPKCISKQRCTQCRRPHHTLLHSASYQGPDVNKSSTSEKVSVSSKSKTDSSCVSDNAAVASVQTVKLPDVTTPTVLLATAWVDIHTAEGRCFKVRALLDQGSNFSFISEALSQTIRTKKKEPTCRLKPVDSWPHLRSLSLADPDPSSHHQIHLLIGADIYGLLLRRDLRQGPPGTPTAQLTAFGWILSGPIGSKKRVSAEAAVLNCVLAHRDVNALLQKFWEDKEISSTTPLTEEEDKCERHFVQTHCRSHDGRYIVRLPFRGDPPIDIGDSLPIARSLYNRMENRLKNQSDLCSQYNEFLAEYESLGHMAQVNESEKTENSPVYIPHHPVVREDSRTTKLRVVFNASCKIRNGTTLNDHLFTGPKLQQDLPAVLSRWRK